ncbi:hypothetical protein F2Q68_00042595 [Brassica cretica]|uniref:Uncharacterized protein n=1 Tax=Brassica cretica TaxID=69181 RepID=A0A8S9MID3_BRACR|nr:hypothetical protein F2Q68_00042595 [Brassica cretica]
MIEAGWNHTLQWDELKRGSPQVVDPSTFGLPAYGVEVNFKVAVTVGSALRIFSLMDTTELLGGPTVDCNVDFIRCICYGGGADGDKYLVTGDDAKRRLEKGGVKFERVKRTPKGIDLKDSQAVDHAIKEDIDESLLQKSPYVARQAGTTLCNGMNVNIPVSLTDTTEPPGGPTVDCNVDSIRCICYGSDKYLVTRDDAKRVVWSTDT